MRQTVRISTRLPDAWPVGVPAPDDGEIRADLTGAAWMLRDGAGGGAGAGEALTLMQDGRHAGPPGGRVGLVVLGMHRSGTSAMARLLNMLGCALPETLMPARAGNEAGHWESEAICAFNDDLLDSAGSHWADWRAINPLWYDAPTYAGWLARGRGVLGDEFAAAPLFVMKDPRQCRLMPFWRDVLAGEGVDARVVLMLRHPWEVAQSLARRDGIGAARAHLLWLGHMLGAEAGSRGMVRALCPYDRVMAARGELALDGLAQDLAGRLGVAWPRLSPRVLGEMAGFLDPAARHHAARDGDRVGGWAERVHAILSGWVDHGETAQDHAELDAIAAALALAGPDLAGLIARNEALEDAAARARQAQGAAEEARDTAQRELAGARGALAGALEWLGEERATNAQRGVDLAQAEQDLEGARARLRDLDGVLAEKDAALAMRDGVLALREAGLLELGALRDALVAERLMLVAQVEQAAGRLAEQDAALEAARALEGERNTRLVQAEAWVLYLAKERHGLERQAARAGRWLAEQERMVAQGAVRERRLGEALEEARAAMDVLRGELADMRAQAAARPVDTVQIVMTPPPPAATTALVAYDRTRGQREDALTALHQQVAAALAGAVVQALPPPRRPARASAAWSAPWAARQAGRSVSFRTAMRDRHLRGVDPHPLFDAGFYDAMAGEHGLAHYRREGWRQGRDPHPLFCNDWYLAQNPHAAGSGMTPLEHYLCAGWRQGARPNPVFDPAAYLALHGDVAAEGMEPLTHYVAHGRGEGRALPGVPGGDADHAWGMMGWLIRGQVAAAEPDAWPPAPVDGYWLPQTLRDVVVSGHGEGAVGLYWYLCSLMERWRGTEGFADSEDCAMLLARMRDLAAEDALPEVTIITPEATIIVPVYNNLLDTMLCLASVLEAGGPGFEIIVADDASSDGTAQVVAQIGGRVRHLRQGANLGFLRNCNVAATQARGRHVVLLNNDTLVLPGWLEALLAPFADARVGLVGAKLINWDGTLQEAGGIYWRDGSAWNFGRGGDVRAPQFNYLKEVDYCSGAAIALPRAVWQALGGFDEHYLPAYCEDADIAFRVRAAGLRCLYQPRAEVVHHEGRSHGRDVGTGIKAYQLANQAKLAERWAGELAGHYANAQNVFRARDRGFDRPHMLVIDHYVPKFDQDAGSRSVFSMIGALVDSGWAVTFWPDNLHEDPDYTPVLQAMGVEVMYGAALSGQFAAFWAERAGLYDAVLLSRPHVAERYLDVLRAGDARLIYYGHDLHHRRLAMQALVGGDGAPTPADIARVKAQEIAVARACHITLLPSEEEAAMLRAAAPGVLARGVPLCVVEPGVIARARSRPPRVADGVLRLLFVGGFGHQPNGDAVLWFAQAVAPVLRAGGHAFHLSIVGGGADAAVRALDGADMAVLGRVDDAALDALYDGVDVVIAPLRFGAGVKGKVVEAMARGVPVATTSVGAQGLAGASLFLGEDAQGFAEAVLRAADGGAAAQACLDYVERCFSQGAMAQVLNECAAREVIHAAA